MGEEPGTETLRKPPKDEPMLFRVLADFRKGGLPKDDPPQVPHSAPKRKLTGWQDKVSVLDVLRGQFVGDNAPADTLFACAVLERWYGGVVNWTDAGLARWALNFKAKHPWYGTTSPGTPTPSMDMDGHVVEEGVEPDGNKPPDEEPLLFTVIGEIGNEMPPPSPPPPPPPGPQDTGAVRISWDQLRVMTEERFGLSDVPEEARKQDYAKYIELLQRWYWPDNPSPWTAKDYADIMDRFLRRY